MSGLAERPRPKERRWQRDPQELPKGRGGGKHDATTTNCGTADGQLLFGAGLRTRGARQGCRSEKRALLQAFHPNVMTRLRNATAGRWQRVSHRLGSLLRGRGRSLSLRVSRALPALSLRLRITNDYKSVGFGIIWTRSDVLECYWLFRAAIARIEPNPPGFIARSDRTRPVRPRFYPRRGGAVRHGQRPSVRPCESGKQEPEHGGPRSTRDGRRAVHSRMVQQPAYTCSPDLARFQRCPADRSRDCRLVADRLGRRNAAL